MKIPGVWLFSLLCAGATFAQTPSPANYSGVWTMQLAKRNFIVLTRRNDGGHFTGALMRPGHFQTGDGITFSQFNQAVVTEPIVSASLDGSHLRFTTQNPNVSTDSTDTR